MLKHFLLLTALGAGLAAMSQCPYVGAVNGGSTVLNGAYVEETIPIKQLMSYPPLREADVMWSKRIWREIDLREKMNHPLYYPMEPTDGRASLWDLIKCATLDGNLTAYSPGPLLDEDEFKQAYTVAELNQIYNSIDSVTTIDIDSDEPITVEVIDALESSEIKKYRIKEDWFFDRKRSVMEVRIVGIAPVKEVIGEDGELRGYAPVFWLYFPECRYVFANAKVFNRKNSSSNLSFDDVFHKRYFSSYIIKEANTYDRSINQVFKGESALLEADAIKDELFKMEHDLWDF